MKLLLVACLGSTVLTGQLPSLGPEAETAFAAGIRAEKAGNLPEAERLYKEAIARGGRTAFVYNNLGTVYQQLGEEVLAIAQFREAIRLRPDYFDPRLSLVSSLLAAGRIDAAVTEGQQALRIKPDDSRASLLLASAYQRANQHVEAIELLRNLCKKSPENAEYIYELGRAYQKLSVWCFKRMRELGPNSGRVQQLLGENYLSQGRMELAVKAYQTAIEVEPGLAGSHLALAYIHARAGEKDQCLRELQKELEVAPESASALELKKKLE